MQRNQNNDRARESGGKEGETERERELLKQGCLLNWSE